MGYALYSTQGYVIDIASISGYEQLVDLVMTTSETTSLYKLIMTGKLTGDGVIKVAIGDVNVLLKRQLKESVKDVLKALREGLKKSKEVAIISQ